MSQAISSQYPAYLPTSKSSCVLAMGTVTVALIVGYIAIRIFWRWYDPNKTPPVHPLDSNILPQMVQQFIIQGCNEMWPCTHKCIIKLYDGRQKKGDLRGDQIYTLIHSMAEKVKFFGINLDDDTLVEVAYENQNLGAPHFRQFEGLTDISNPPQPWATSNEILTRCFSNTRS